MLKWKKDYSSPFDCWTAKSGTLSYRVTVLTHFKTRVDARYDNNSLPEFRHGPIDGDADYGKRACQEFHDARVAAIARANGYVKLGDDEIVVKREHAKSCLAALDDTTRARINPGDPTAYGHIQRALDASGVGK